MHGKDDSQGESAADRWLAGPVVGGVPVRLPHLMEHKSFLADGPGNDRVRVRYYLREADQVLVARAWFGPGAQGPPGHAHGGSTAALMDEAMGGLCWVTGRPVLAGELTIRYRRMAPLETPLVVETRLESVEGRKARTTGVLQRVDGTPLVEARGIFIRPDPKTQGDLLARAAELVELARES